MAEYGIAELTIIKKSPLFAGVPEKNNVLMSHGDDITLLPPFYSKKIKAECVCGNVHQLVINLHITADNFLSICTNKGNWTCQCGKSLTVTPYGIPTSNLIPKDKEFELLRTGKTKQFIEKITKKLRK